MHFMAFAFKRAHYTSLRVSRKYAEPFGLTPARFDMLYAISRNRLELSQASLARVLGLSDVTVSRMLRMLEGLGLIRRSVYWRDRRAKSVWLTNAGRRRLYLVLRKLKRRPLQFAFMRVVTCAKGFSRFLQLDDAYWLVRRMTERLGDGATLKYPTWHPDD